MTCWETIAETLHEIRSCGHFSEDAIAFLKNELATLDNEKLRRSAEEIIARENFGDTGSINEVFELLANTDQFKHEVARIVTGRLLNERDA